MTVMRQGRVDLVADDETASAVDDLGQFDKLLAGVYESNGVVRTAEQEPPRALGHGAVDSVEIQRVAGGTVEQRNFSHFAACFGNQVVKGRIDGRIDDHAGAGVDEAADRLHDDDADVGGDAHLLGTR